MRRSTPWRRCRTACRARRATLAANMETALNALWDAAPGPATASSWWAPASSGCS